MTSCAASFMTPQLTLLCLFPSLCDCPAFRSTRQVPPSRVPQSCVSQAHDVSQCAWRRCSQLGRLKNQSVAGQGAPVWPRPLAAGQQVSVTHSLFVAGSGRQRQPGRGDHSPEWHRAVLLCVAHAAQRPPLSIRGTSHVMITVDGLAQSLMTCDDHCTTT